MENSNPTKKQLNRYYSKIRRNLLCKQKNKNRIINDLKGSVELFIENNPNSNMLEIINHFGTPQAIARGFIENSEIDLKKQLNRKRLISAISIILLTLTMILTTIIATIILHNYNRDVAYYYDITLTDENNILENGEN